jgi:hypothetical protein
MTEQGSSVEAMDLDQYADVLPAELGIRLSSVFMYDRLVFVEGPSDEAILREWAATLDLNISEAGVGFVHLGGGRNFRHFASNSIMEVVSRRGVRAWFLLDKDERTDKDIEAMQKALPNRAELAVLDVRELENHLLEPRALSSWLSSRIAESGRPQPAKDEIEDLDRRIDEIAGSMFDDVVSKQVTHVICAPVFPSRDAAQGSKDLAEAQDKVVAELSQIRDEILRRQADTAPAFDRVREQLLGVWDSQKKKLAPGDTVLDRLFQQFGLRYHKSSDGPGIASRMLPNDVPRQISEFLRSIVASEQPEHTVRRSR